eukprot:scaffold14085_cov142-Isochrysis_galbana.AAC.1
MIRADIQGGWGAYHIFTNKYPDSDQTQTQTRPRPRTRCLKYKYQSLHPIVQLAPEPPWPGPGRAGFSGRERA